MMLTAVAGLPRFRCRQNAGTILVAEDEDEIRLCLAEFLVDSGFLVLQAADVAEARIILENNDKVDLVFSDINMPGGETGFALAQLVLRHYPDTRVLLTSGMPQVDEDTRDLPEPLILKPYSYASVLQHIQRLLQAVDMRLLQAVDMPLARHG
jgi:DNA-binding NtrC family response regulator